MLLCAIILPGWIVLSWLFFCYWCYCLSSSLQSHGLISSRSDPTCYHFHHYSIIKCMILCVCISGIHLHLFLYAPHPLNISTQCDLFFAFSYQHVSIMHDILPLPWLLAIPLEYWRRETVCPWQILTLQLLTRIQSRSAPEMSGIFEPREK